MPSSNNRRKPSRSGSVTSKRGSKAISKKNSKQDLSFDNRSDGGKSKISVNPPSQYLDKYYKNNPTRTLESNLKKTRDRIQTLKEELEKAQEVTDVSSLTQGLQTTSSHD